jgi:hypothetical protein
MYREVPVRDNLQLRVVSTPPKEPSENYLVNKPICTVILTKNKTSDKYNDQEHTLSKTLSTAIRAYLKSRDHPEYLFGSAPLSSFVKQMNKKIGVDGSINLLRHMTVTERLNDSNVTPEQRAELAMEMGHSVGTQPKYLKNVT